MSWETVALGDVASLDRRTVLPREISGAVSYIGLEHIARGGEILGFSTVEKSKLTSAKFSFDATHVLFGKLRPNLGKVARPAFDGVCSTDIIPVKAGSRLHRDYLVWYLRQPQIVGLAASQATGANLPRLNPRALAAFPVPLPPLSEQRRIAAILDHADEIRTKRRELLAHLDELPQALFVEMFGDPGVPQNSFPRSPLGELGTILTGNTPSRSIAENFGPGMEWVKSDNLGGAIITPAVEHLSLAGQQKARIAPAGSVLVVCIAGSPASIGRASVADRVVAFNQQINAILPTPRLDPIFLFHQFRTAPRLVQAKSTGGMKGLVSKSAFSAVEIVHPPLVDQQAFATKVKAIQAERDLVARALEADNELFDALQYRAFRGEL
ncbi:type I restriction enzyme S subunit [Mycolicibacterium mucogenicum 261Sha1.1M5]|nr:type I restriction enzyme S subunit [Mycolicibacterium mucogenicum 261Sha1.1M5]